MKKYGLVILFILLTISLFGTSIGWGNLQWPYAISIVQGDTTESIYGQVWMSGVTDSPGMGAGITAELGYGADGSTPDATWTWFTALYNGDPTAGNDEYRYELVCSMAPGLYDYTYRYQYTGDPDYYYAAEIGNLTVNAAPPPTYNVTFQVDMEHQTVDPAGVFISGSFNGWGTTAMTPPVRANIYTVTLVLESAYYEYKYVNGAGYETIDNRTITTPGTDHIVPVVFFDDFAGGTTQTVDVTFSVNMGLIDPGWYAGGVSVQGSVAPLDWTAGSNLLTDPDENLVYTGTFQFPIGSAYDVEYKFARDDGVARTWYWEESSNRPFTIDDSSPTQTLDMNYWNDDEPVPVYLSSFYALYIGGTPTINWVTQSESDNIGWNVYRAISNNFGQAQILNLNTIPGNGTTSQPSFYSFTDEYQVQENSTYWYWLESISGSGETESFGPVSLTITPDGNEIPEIPMETALHQNFPNPFNPSTLISFEIKENETGVLSIYNIKGQLIVKEEFGEGRHSYTWDAKNHSSGIYLYKLQADRYSKIIKMLLVK